jgi:hypothetical protein
VLVVCTLFYVAGKDRNTDGEKSERDGISNIGSYDIVFLGRQKTIHNNITDSSLVRLPCRSLPAVILIALCHH